MVLVNGLRHHRSATFLTYKDNGQFIREKLVSKFLLMIINWSNVSNNSELTNILLLSLAVTCWVLFIAGMFRKTQLTYNLMGQRVHFANRTIYAEFSPVEKASKDVAKQSEVSQKDKHQYSILMHIYGI